MYNVNVDLKEYSYNVYIKRGLLNDEEVLKKHVFSAKAIIISEENVFSIHGINIMETFKKYTDVETIIVSEGEESKSLETLSYVYDKLAEYDVTSKDTIVAFGGGVVGDLAGFAAATFKRGIPFISIPTTLLSQVDSSVGGKTAVNHKAGKNLIGAFYQPKAVFIDTAFLDTLPIEVFKDGLCEVIKYGCIYDRELFEMLLATDLSNLSKDMDDIVYRCCDLKAKTVSEDEFDTGERMKLNFGHTIGYGIESVLKYGTISHGLAVGIGMYEITKNAERLGLTPVNISDMIKEILIHFELPYEMPDIDKNALLSAMSNDKKSRSEKINLILLKKIGKCYIYETRKDELHEFIKE